MSAGIYIYNLLYLYIKYANLYIQIIITIDYVLFLSAIAYSLKCAFLVVVIIWAFIYVSIVENRQINDQLLKKVTKSSSIARCCQILAWYRVRHTANTAQILNVNAQIISKGYFAYISGNLFFSVYTNVFLHYGNASDLLYYFLVTTLITETLFPLMAALLLINCNRYLISSVPMVFSILAKFSLSTNPNTSMIREQWKASVYLQLLHSKRKLALTAGEFGPFTRNNLFKVSKKCFHHFHYENFIHSPFQTVRPYVCWIYIIFLWQILGHSEEVLVNHSKTTSKVQ